MKTSKAEWKVQRIAKMYETKKVNFDLVIQRKQNIWDTKRKSTLIHSVLVGYPIPGVFASKDESTYHFLDGKQRLTSFFEFINNQFALHQAISPVNDVELAGKKFSELPEEMQTQILNYPIDIIKIEEITMPEMEELFYRLNNGVPLRQIETTRAILGSKVLRFVEEIASMTFFSEKANLSKAAKRRYVDQELVLQILALVKDADTGFSSKEIQAFVQDLRNTEIQDELRAKMQNACFYLNEAFLKKEKFLRKLHVPMLFKLVLNIQESGSLITPTEFSEWTTHFFENVPEDYSAACQSGSARKENVQRRLSIMTSAFNAYFDIKKRREAENHQIEDDEGSDTDATPDAKPTSEKAV